MHFGKNQWGETIEVFGKSIHLGRGESSVFVAREILSAMNNLKSPRWRLEFQDQNCESHYIPLIISPSGFPHTITFYYEGKYLGAIVREEVKHICENRLEAEYYAMHI